MAATDGGWPDKPGKERLRLSALEQKLVDVLGVRIVQVDSVTQPHQIQKVRKVGEDEDGNWYGISGVKPATPLEYALYEMLRAKADEPPATSQKPAPVG